MGRYMISNVYVAAGLATIGAVLQGFDVTSMSSIIGTKQYRDYFDNPGSTEQGGITASMAGGSLLGSLLSTVISDRRGRRDTMFVACCFWIVGSSLMSSVQSTTMLIVARMVNGFAVGMLTSQGPVYIAEIAPANRRGRLISIQNWSCTWGILIMYLITYGCSFIKSNASFRIPWAIQMIPAIFLMSAIPFMPRSPRWLATQDRWEETIEVLAALHAKGDRHDPLIIAEVHEIRENITQERSYGENTWSELFTRRNIVRVHTALFTHLWAQYSGQNALMYYIVYMFQMAGLNGQTSLTASIIQYVINCFMTVPAILFNDRFRRRWVMMSGSFGMAVFLILIGSLMKSYGHYIPGGLNGVKAVSWEVTNPHASKAIIACSFLFVATSAVSWGPIAWLYPPEVTPLYIRSKTISLATAINWTGNFTLTFYTPPGFQNIQYRLYFIFATFNLLAFVHVYLLFQETVGKTLEEMDYIFSFESVWAPNVKVGPSMLVEDIEDARGGLGMANKSKEDENMVNQRERRKDGTVERYRDLTTPPPNFQ